MNFIVLSSSRGTTFQAVIDALRSGALTATCLGLVADREDRECVARAREADLPVAIVTRRASEDREAYDRRLDKAIRSLGKADILAAMGWMWILSAEFVSEWEGRIVNVHPALLPKYPGAHGIADALAAGDTETGMTIHLVDDGVDTGPILLQKTCPIQPSDTVDTLKERVQALEKQWYPAVLQMIEKGEILVR
ncbi:phosphoribosylglycinamide formyltransferase [Candidatus Peribacteria bacterium]|nr:phosphoribosylglycinamide formyltransferase [Candidatus Peribacteria bacterium]